MKNILVPTDFSDQALAAVDLACQIGKRTSATVTLLSVVEVPTSGSFNTMGPTPSGFNPTDNVYVVEMMAHNKKLMEKLVNDDAYDGCDLRYLVLVGNPTAQIKETTKDGEMDLIIMGSKGTSGLQEVLVGSNTEKVVRHSKVPVITIKQKVNLEDIKTIAYATNLHDEENGLIDKLMELASFLGAALEIVRINTPNNFQSDQVTQQQLKKFCKKNELEKAGQHSYNDGVEEDGIRNFAEFIGADMIAMGTHGRTGLVHLISGSIAEDIVNHAKRPVWTCVLK